MPNQRTDADANTAAMNLSEMRSIAAEAAPQPATPGRPLFGLRDPLGIARGMAQSILDVVADLRPLSEGAATHREVSVLLDELGRTASMIEVNVTRALVIAEQYGASTNRA